MEEAFYILQRRGLRLACGIFSRCRHMYVRDLTRILYFRIAHGISSSNGARGKYLPIEAHMENGGAAVAKISRAFPTTENRYRRRNVISIRCAGKSSMPREKSVGGKGKTRRKQYQLHISAVELISIFLALKRRLFLSMRVK